MKSMIRLLFRVCLIGSFAIGGWLLWDRFPSLQEFVKDKIHSSEFHTLEVRFSAEEIMERQRSNLIKDEGYVYLEPRLIFYPYVMMDMKFSTTNSSTQEGILLWGLTDGEMVVDTTNWQKTHGFEDCLLAKANKNDFKILRAIMEAGGAIDRERLYQRFKSEGDLIDKWINQCKEKKLVVSSGSCFRLHLENPALENIPITLLHEPLVAQPTRHAMKSKKRYSVQQIRKMAEVAFGPDFAVRHQEQIFLPVYSITVQNPDGSLLVTHWNALNGKQFD